MYRGRFSHKQKLYAAKATLEGFAVWMPVHTNLCEEYNKNHSWYNFIIGDEIKEVWFIEDYELLSDDSTRVCFAKNTEGYVFQGVYVPVRTQKEEIKGKLELVRTFKRISIIYPIEKQKNEATILKVASEKTTEYVETSLVIKKCQIEAYNIDKDKPIKVCVEELFPIYQEKIVGKRKGETYSLNGQTYRIDKILIKKK